MGDNTSAKSSNSQSEPILKGWLFKWTNYLKGYQRRWFVLQNGHLSYYRAEYNGAVPTFSIRRKRRFKNGNQAEMAHTCRGSISLHGALIYTVDASTFVISNGGTQQFHIRAASEVERQRWVTALELAKGRAIRNMDSEEDDDHEEGDPGSPEEWSAVVKKLEIQLNELQSCSDLIAKHWKILCKPLAEIEANIDPELIQSKSKEISERATLYRISTNAMINACAEYLKTAQNHGHKWIRLLQHEREQRQRLQDMVETLAQQHSKLEQAANAHTYGPTLTGTEEDEDENEFFDAVAESSFQQDPRFIDITIDISGGAHLRDSSDSSSENDVHETKKHVVLMTGGTSRKGSQLDQNDSRMAMAKSVSGSNLRQRRSRVPEKPNFPLNLWGIMKNCIGKDLSKIPMPVNFNEPLSMLQRLTEDYEYADILDIAAECSDPCEQMAYVAAFTISSYSTTSARTGKPFNPLLGETYECDRTEDLGWRAINEQVSHHPPMAAQYCEGKSWACWQEFTMTSKFRGKYLQIIPLGTAHVEFSQTGNKYAWRKVTTTVHNIIVGKLWVDQHGDMEIIGKGPAEGIKCVLKFIPYSYFSRDTQRRVKGVVMDVSGNVKWVINGTWDDQVEIAPVIGSTGPPSNPIHQTGPPILAWKRIIPEYTDNDSNYGFTLLASQLNEFEEGVAPTDSRLRPDQRLMEEGRWEDANIEKVRLEEKQRAVRREREAAASKAASEGVSYEPYKPVWFEQTKDDTGTIRHVYNGSYWKCKEQQDWSLCPNIF